MMRKFVEQKRLGRCWTMVMAVVAVVLMAAGPDKPDLWERARAKSGQPEVKPVDELFNEAEAYFQGRETWFGKLVRKSKGEQSKEYRTWKGIKQKNYARSIELYQTLLDNYPYSKYAPQAELRLAECHYFMEEYEEAGIGFEQFVHRRPRHREVPYALYQQGMCHYQQMRKAGRDQAQTREALAVFEELKRRFPDCPYAKEADLRARECLTRLAEHELVIADFYFKRREYWPAAGRYYGVWNAYPGLGFDARAIFMEGECYRALGKTDRAAERYNQVITGFPQSDYAQKAKERLAGLKTEEKPSGG